MLSVASRLAFCYRFDKFGNTYRPDWSLAPQVSSQQRVVVSTGCLPIAYIGLDQSVGDVLLAKMKFSRKRTRKEKGTRRRRRVLPVKNVYVHTLRAWFLPWRKDLGGQRRQLLQPCLMGGSQSIGGVLTTKFYCGCERLGRGLG